MAGRSAIPAKRRTRATTAEPQAGAGRAGARELRPARGERSLAERAAALAGRPALHLSPGSPESGAGRVRCQSGRQVFPPSAQSAAAAAAGAATQPGRSHACLCAQQPTCHVAGPQPNWVSPVCTCQRDAGCQKPARRRRRLRRRPSLACVNKRRQPDIGAPIWIYGPDWRRARRLQAGFAGRNWRLPPAHGYENFSQSFECIIESHALSQAQLEGRCATIWATLATLAPSTQLLAPSKATTQTTTAHRLPACARPHFGAQIEPFTHNIATQQHEPANSFQLADHLSELSSARLALDSAFACPKLSRQC